MARRNPVRDALLAQVKQAERRATAKVSRNRAAGANIGGTEYDPRAGIRNLDAFTTRELRKHLRGLEGFISRDTQFTGLEGGVPVPRSAWREYQALERQNNRNVDAREDQLSNVPTVGSERRPAGRRETVADRRNRLGDVTQTRVFQKFHEKPQNITSARALQRLVDRMRERTAPGFVERENSKHTSRAEKMLRAAGMTDLAENLLDLTSNQQNALFENTGFWSVLRDNYPEKDSTVSDILDISFREREGIERGAVARDSIVEHLQWVRTVIPKDEPIASPPRNRSRSRRKPL